MISRHTPQLTALIVLVLAAAPGAAPPGTAEIAHGYAMAAATAVDDGATGYTSPVGPNPVVLRPFDPPPQPWLAGHRGVDLRASAGVVLAPADGRVSFAGPVVDRGVLVLEHPDGLRSSFEAVATALTVGAAVRRGQVVAQVEPSGHCPEHACVHWGVRAGERYLDPMTLLGHVRVVLLPPR
ncbi:MAG: M23 family metallopeptidase [Cellulomonadaceae bacterium]